MKWMICILLALTLPLTFVNGQSGCTDPLANNYDPSAMINDGSCLYSPTNYSLEYIQNLPATLVETSALAYFNNQLWSLNDSGNSNEIYQFDTLSGEILHTCVLRGVDNMDWEDMAEDDTYLYVGDFGNNAGDRTDLVIFQIAKTDLTQDIVDVASITFEYSDQVDFPDRDYDCEAFFNYGDSLYLFSKNWVDNQTRLYSLPKIPGNHTARLQAKFDIDGLITAADIDSSGNIALLGYKGFDNILWLLFDYPQTQFFEGNKRRIELGNVFSNGQAEGLSFSSNGRGYISAEEISQFGVTIPQRFFRFSIQQWVDSTSVALNDAFFEGKLKVIPNPFRDNFTVELLNPDLKQLEIQVYNSLGIPILKGIIDRTTTFDLSTYPNGYYYCCVIKGDQRMVIKLVKQ